MPYDSPMSRNTPTDGEGRRGASNKLFVWDERLLPLTRRRAGWVIVRETPNYNAAHVTVISIKNRRVPTTVVDLSEFEFRARTNPEHGGGEVWARVRA